MPVSKITHRSKEGDRDIIVINGYAFYRSTGNNSNMPGTWFPFKGIAPELFGGWFIKPSDPNLLLSKALMTQEYFSQRDSKGTIARFGNIETAYLSYCLGGSCWQKAKKSFDLEHDPLKIKNWFHYTFIKYFASQNIDLGQTIEVNEEADFITEDNQLVNKWLVEQGAKHILLNFDQMDTFPLADECNLLDIDLNEIDCSVTENSHDLKLINIQLELIKLIDKTLVNNDQTKEKFKAIAHLKNSCEDPNLSREDLQKCLLQFERLVSHKRIGFRSLGFLANSYSDIKDSIIDLRNQLDLRIDETTIQQAVRGSSLPKGIFSYSDYVANNNKEFTL